ncbi:expressed unknown protein [Ectocarpus siliculosus]|uniref:Uncharacterized protein n=1 Tax=Ectocarpus siliculosus TaxID=2880 RepID=D8LAT4_ECTSI|nr:expressed unknown protein [Ectocarpus siliculosus]|eukprot:CBN76443.1 expressed unknown protein [Ectocarpus siliculosus]
MVAGTDGMIYRSITAHEGVHMVVSQPLARKPFQSSNPCFFWKGMLGTAGMVTRVASEVAKKA